MGKNVFKYSDKSKLPVELPRKATNMKFYSLEKAAIEICGYLNFRQRINGESGYYSPESIMLRLKDKETNIEGLVIQWQKRGLVIQNDKKDNKLFQKWKKRKLDITPEFASSGQILDSFQV